MKSDYKIRGRKISLEIDHSVVAVRYKEPALHSVRARIATIEELAPFDRRTEIPKEKYTIIEVEPAHAGKRSPFHSAHRKLNRTEEVARVAPVFKVGKNRVIATDRLAICLTSKGVDVEALLEKYDMKLLETYGDHEILVSLSEDTDPLELADALSDEADVDYAEPDFVTLGKHTARRTVRDTYIKSGVALPNQPYSEYGDPLSDQQYAITITEAVAAWKIQAGSSNIIIAILDEGVDTRHQDLNSAVTGTYDAIDGDDWQEPQPWDAHGTACAGLAAAIHNNNRGIKGIGGGCSLLAVRIAYSQTQGGGWITSNSAIRSAIDWSWQNGADVLSNSWGGGAYSQAIVDAFERARTKGRNGLGSVIVVAAGNDSSPVDFPGYLDNVLTVSASNEYDEFKTKTSRDGEFWWGSNYGDAVDVAAPGVHNLTTDMVGEDGYSEDNYADFNGTSSATPIVAGACGLLFSKNPNATESVVRAAIRESADKVGYKPYNNQGRNDEMGWGRLNVNIAVQSI